MDDPWGRALAALSCFRLSLHVGAVEEGIAAGREALQRFRALDDPWGVPWTTMWLASATRALGDLATAQRLFADAIDAAHDLAYVRCQAHAESGVLAAWTGDHQRSQRSLAEAERVAAVTGVRDSAATAANAAGLAARLRGEPAPAVVLHERALALYEELASDIGIAVTRCGLGYAQLDLGQPDAAERCLRDALRLADRTGRPDTVAPALEGLARILAPRSAFGCAVLLGVARQIRDDTGLRVTLVEGHDAARSAETVRAVLGERAFQAAGLQGHRLLGRGIVTLLAEDGPDAVEGRGGADTGPCPRP